MNPDLVFVLNSALLGFGLAMDAFSVSMADGLSAPGMKRGVRLAIPLTFAAFQFAMPVIGWFCVRTIAGTFRAFQRAIPWIALILLGFIGTKMLAEGILNRDPSDIPVERLTPGVLLMQGVATSIDALSAGFTIAGYRLGAALTASGIIAMVTWAVCSLGLGIGRRFGARFAGRASMLGGVILIIIGLEIFIRGL